MNHLLYMDDLRFYGKKSDLEALINTVRRYTNDVRMEFRISKCATVLMKRGKKVEYKGIQMPGGIDIEDFGEREPRSTLEFLRQKRYGWRQ